MYRTAVQRRLVAGMAVLLAVAASVVAPQETAAYADAGGRGGDFVPLTTPAKVLDTSTGVGGVTGVRGAASTTAFQVLGASGLPTTGVNAVLARVITKAPTAATWLTVYPDGTSRPGVSALNVTAGQTISNTAVVKVGGNGKLAVYNNAGQTHIIIEVQGYFTTATGSTWGGLVPVTQTRAVDTRSGVGTTTGTIASGASRTVNLANGGIPVGASAAFVTLTVIGATVAGSLTAVPAGVTTAPLGILNYEDGTNTVSGASLKLAADGRVTFVNKGSAAVHLVVDTLAYFTATPTAGAGFRPVVSRVFDAQVAANATADVMVSGTNGLPIRGVAAVAVDLYASGTATGWLRAWTPTGAEPTTSQTYHGTEGGRRSLAFVKPDAEGKIRVRNISSAPVRLVVDLEGWFAEPLPIVPVAQFAPISVLQDSPRTVQYAYVDNLGRVVSGHQPTVDNFNSVQWTVISGNEAFSGQPAFTPLPDGRTQLAAQYTDSDVWATSQTAAEAATWNGWSDLGGSMAAPPAMARLSTGVPVLFAVDADGKLFVYAQTSGVRFWRSLGDQNLTGTPTVVAVRDGLQVVARDTAGAVKTILYYTDGSVSAWTNLGGATVTDTPTVVVYPGYRLRVFVRVADGTISTKLQDAAGTFPAAWEPVGTFVARGRPAAILDPTLGRTAVVVRGTDDLVYRAWETEQGSGVFGSWAPAIENLADPSATDLTVAPVTTANGQGWIIVFRNINSAVRVYERRVDDVSAAAARQAPAAAPGGSTFTATTLPTPPG
jgi:hypothetical protein